MLIFKLSSLIIVNHNHPRHQRSTVIIPLHSFLFIQGISVDPENTF
jgi:hypothetical protein